MFVIHRLSFCVDCGVEIFILKKKKTEILMGLWFVIMSYVVYCSTTIYVGLKLLN